MAVVIQNALAKPSLEKLGEKDFFQLFMGVELELEPQGMMIDALEFVEETLGDFVIVKQDGTVALGFEICTQPATLEYHEKRWAAFFKSAEEKFRNYTTEHNEKRDHCGMHVHINRAGLTNLQIGKIVAFIHREENRGLIEEIAGRKSNEFCNFEIPKTFRDGLSRYNLRAEKRVGVNLINLETIEVRIFKTPLTFELFLKNLEFCHALIQFTTAGKMSLQDSVEGQKFLEFVQMNHKFYPNLFNFLKNHGRVNL